MKKTIAHIIAFATLLVATSFSPKNVDTFNLELVFLNYVGNWEVGLDTVSYTNPIGQKYTVTKVKYYIGHINLKKQDGSKLNIGGYYLIDEDEEKSKHVMCNNIPTANYTGLEFIIGVDSIDNCSGAQAGALDPTNAMFWAWNTGYIFLKLEGKSPASKSPGTSFEYHIGGFKAPNNCIRKISLPFVSILNIGDGNTLSMHLKANLANITDLDFSKLSSVTDFHNATFMADKYANMFSITPFSSIMTTDSDSVK